jgi:acetyltransferase-like isoleucine patch superfamily enzyme
MILFDYKNQLNKNNYYKNKGTSWCLDIQINGKNNSVVITEGCSLRHLKIVIIGDNHQLVLEKNVNIKSGILWLEGSSNKIEIGKYTTIEGAHIASIESSSSVKIGEDCMLSDKIVIRNGDSHSIIDSKSKHRLNPSGNILINNHVWIGSNVTILKNVHIKSNSIIGINSLVTRDIDANTLVAGSPAKKLREGVDWKRELI